MLILDLRRDVAPTEADVVVIGSGPAGMTAAATLATAGLDVLVVESGDKDGNNPEGDLDRIENVGEPRIEPQRRVRRRGLGGTSWAWSGRCRPLDQIDLEERDWVANSGWPLKAGELAPHLTAAAEILGLGEQEYGDGVWSLLGRRTPSPAPDSRRLLPAFWHFARGAKEPWAPTRFATDVPGVPAVLTYATAVRLTAITDEITEVEVAAPGGPRANIRARAVVVAGGAIETPRLLLASALGNDWVGRCLMDHPGIAIGRVAGAGARKVRDRFGQLWRRARPYRLAYVPGLVLSPEVQRAEHLLNAACWLEEFPARDDPWQAVIRLVRRRSGAVDDETVQYWRVDEGSGPPPGVGEDVLAVLRHPIDLVAGGLRIAGSRPPIYRANRVDLYALVEQLPDPDSRITLAEETDALGMPRPRIDWRLHDEEFHAMRRLLDLVRDEFPKMGLPAPVPVPWMSDADAWRQQVVDRAHMLGTVRMAADADHGAAAPDGRVYGTSNVYVADGSLFPTSGHANPTLTIVALARHVATAIAGQLAGPRATA